MEGDFESKFQLLEEKLNQIEESVEKTRKYLWWSMVLQLGMVLVPLLLIMLAIPFLLSSFSQMYDSLL